MISCLKSQKLDEFHSIDIYLCGLGYLVNTGIKLAYQKTHNCYTIGGFFLLKNQESI